MVWKSFIKFYVLCFLLLGLIPLLALIFNQGSLDFSNAAIRASEITGIAWTSNLIDVFQLVLVEPVLLLLVLGSAVPALAALLNLAFKKSKIKWRTFINRLNPAPGLSAISAIRTYLQIILFLILALFASYFIRSITGYEYSWSFDLISSELMWAILIAAFLDQGAVFEEFGWRGFATNELQDNGVSPLKTAFVIGVCWGLWHVPRDITTGVIENLGLIRYLMLFLPSFILGTVSVSVIASYYMNKLNGSVIPAIVVHGISNDSIGISGNASIMEALTPYYQISKALPFALLALIFIISTGSRLGYSKY